METRNDGGKRHVRIAPEIKVVVPVAQGKSTRAFAQSAEGARKVRATAGGDNDVPAIPVKVKIDIRCRDGILRQRQPRVVLQCQLKQLYWSGSTLNCACPTRVWRTGRH